MAKRKKHTEEQKEDSFSLLFVALNLILLSFFILLTALSQQDESRARKAIGSLLGAFGILEGGENVTPSGSDPTQASPVSRGSQHRKLKQAMEKKLKRKLLGQGDPEVSVILTADHLRVVFTDKLPFRVGGAELNPTVFPALDSIAATLKRANALVVVRGWADPSPYPQNLELSAIRAVRVARYLVEAAGIKGPLVRAEGWGVNKDGLEAGRFVELILPTSSLIKPLGKI